MNRLNEYDFTFCYRFSRDQHIDIVDDLNKRSIKLQFILKKENQDRLAMLTLNDSQVERHIYSLQILKRADDYLTKYRQSLIYHELIDYLESNETRTKELKISRNRRKALRYLTKFYRLSFSTEDKHLRYVKVTSANNICLTEEEISRFLKATHENHDHYVFTLTLDYLMSKAY